MSSLMILSAIMAYNITMKSSIDECFYDDIQLYGDVQVVDSFPDIKVQIVDSFPDLNVKLVKDWASACGEWNMVEAFPDFTIQYVDSFPDIKIKMVESFPGQP